MSELLAAALAYAADGLRVFPLAPREKVPLIPGGRGCNDATTDEAQIRAWWAKCPDANIGVSTGDGLLVIDVDGDDGCTSLIRLCDEHGPIPVTRCVSTGRVGGFHFWLRATGPACRNSNGIRNGLALGIDTRGAGGYVVAPPSIHPDGRPYKASPKAPIADAPQWLVDLLTPKVVERTGAPVVPTISTETTPYGRKAIELECEKVRTIGEGHRNDQLNASAYSLGQLEAGGEIAFGDAGPALEDAAAAAGLPVGQSHKTIYTSGLPDGRENPRTAPERTAAPKRPPGEPSRAERARGVAATIESRARKAASAGANDLVAEILTALGDDGSLAGSDTPAAIARVATLARDAANRLDGPRLALALRATDGARRKGL